MTQPRVEHLTVQSDRPATTAPAGFWPPLPAGLWLPPAAGMLVPLAAVTALCLSGPQATPDAPAGWFEPHNAPTLIAWVATLSAIFLAPQLCTPRADQPHPGWKRMLQAAAVALPLAALAWAFDSIGLLLGAQTAAAAPGAAAADTLTARGLSTALPAGLLFALTLGAVAAGAWIWIRRRPVFGTLVLIAWSALPPLTWFLSVDILGRDPAPQPAWLAVNPVYLPVLIARSPEVAPLWTLPATLALLAFLPLTLAAVERGRRRPPSALVNAAVDSSPPLPHNPATVLK